MPDVNYTFGGIEATPYICNIEQNIELFDPAIAVSNFSSCTAAKPKAVHK